MQQSRGVEALLEKLPNEEPQLSEAIVLALGDSKSSLALPAIVSMLDHGKMGLQLLSLPTAFFGLC